MRAPTTLAPPVRSVYLASGGPAAFAQLHETVPSPGDVAVLLVPPFGWADICSYRVRRAWATSLAAEGHPTLRLDLPGTGDAAGGPSDGGLADAWTAALAGAADWLRAETGCRRVAAIGPGLGGLLTLRALAAGAALDELVLWGTSARGRALVRELRAFARMERAAQSQDARLPEGALAVNGYLLSAETLAAVGAFDAGAADVKLGAAARALLLERDGIAVDGGLREALDAAGLDVTVAPGPGYGGMLVEPQDARAPIETMATVSAWLAEAPPATDRQATTVPTTERTPRPATASVRLEPDDDAAARVRETPLVVPHPFGAMSGILCEPLDGTGELCAVLLNAGSQRRTGPNRMWVEIARRWAAAGVPVLRVDLAGIGDAGGDDDPLREPDGYYVPAYVEQTRTLLDALAARGLPQRYVLVGLCAGAYWSLHGALADERVAAVGLLNPRALTWDAWVNTSRRLRDLRELALRRDTWRRVLRGEITLAKHLGTLKGVARRLAALPARLARRLRRDERDAAAPGHPAEALLDRLRDRGQRGLVLFTGKEPLRRELAATGWFDRLDGWPNVRVAIRGDDTDTHTLQPLSLQRETHALLDELLAAERQRARTPGLSGAAGAPAPQPAGAPARTGPPS